MEHALAEIRDSPVDGVFVVVGDNSEAVRKLIEPYGFSVVENLEWGAGQSTSVLRGLDALGSDFDGAVVMLADQPLVGARCVERLVRAFEEGAMVAVATYGGRRRNPVLFSRGVWPELMGELRGDEGARAFLRARRDLVTEVPCDDVADPSDIDTREELAALEEVEPPAGGGL